MCLMAMCLRSVHSLRSVRSSSVSLVTSLHYFLSSCATFISLTSAPRTRVAPFVIPGMQALRSVSLSVPICPRCVLLCFAKFTTPAHPHRKQDSFTSRKAIPSIPSVATLVFAPARLDYGAVYFPLRLVHPGRKIQSWNLCFIRK